MSRAVLKCLSLVLGAFFVFVGVLKLTPAVSPDMHKELKRNFASQAKVFPLTSVLNFKISPKLYREVVGYAEVVCGLLLLFAPDAAGQLATALLFSIVTLAIYSHWKLQDRFDRIAPGVVMALLLACRFIVFVQMRRKRQKPQQLPDKYSTESSTATTAASSSSSVKKSD